ncbi:MAG: DUF1993 domain-containing protein [Cyanobacteria bacterium P01_A01_bin.105]
MPLSTYQTTVPPLIRALDNLIGILTKGAAYAETKNIDHSVLLSTRLFPDMFPLSRQVQIAADVAKRGTARLAEVEPPSAPDEETTFEELIDRLKKTIEYLETFTSEQLDGAEEKTISLPVRGETMTFDGYRFLFGFVLPNVYFHVTTAYDILRHCGVEIGKADYLGVS